MSSGYGSCVLTDAGTNGVAIANQDSFSLTSRQLEKSTALTQTLTGQRGILHGCYGNFQ